MLERAKEIIYKIPYEEVVDFYECLVGETCGSVRKGDYRNHIYAKLHRNHRWYRINKKVNKDSLMTCYVIRCWLHEMSIKYKLETDVTIPRVYF